ncbi:MAG: DNA primase [Micrococcaceae bacterium]
MPGFIKRDVVEEVRERADLKAIVEETVTLKSAGVGTWKGLCPFHDEKTPSFTVKPQAGYYHCFGCGEGGDIFSFLMNTEQLSFSEAVEELAAKYGVQVQYEEGTFDKESFGGSTRQQLLAVNKAAAEFFVSKLISLEAQTARTFLLEKGFQPEFINSYEIGYAPNGWDNLIRHLKGRGYSEKLMDEAGLISMGQRGAIDKFRGRLIWPIKDGSNQVLGFGARKLYDEDQGPKYLNTNGTKVYKKSQVLYGLDKAKKPIAIKKQVVVVEGYTDVMACHAAGIETAVATCGTAFGHEHVRVIRRLMADAPNAEVIFTFDGDEAGKKAAEKAFEEDQNFAAQTYVAVAEAGMDPCDLRLNKGNEALHALLATKTPLFEFKLKTEFDKYQLDTVEQRSRALTGLAPILNRIKDPMVRPAYIRKVASWLGVDVQDVERQMRLNPATIPTSVQQEPEPANITPTVEELPPTKVYLRPDPQDKAAQVEREALEVMVQHPELLTEDSKNLFLTSVFEVEAYAEVAKAIREAIFDNVGANEWVGKIRAEVPGILVPLVGELAMRDLPASTETELTAYSQAMVVRLKVLELDRAKTDAQMRMSRLGPIASTQELKEIQTELIDIEIERRGLLYNT